MKSKQQRKKKHKNPDDYVTLDLCHAYQKALDTKIKYLFGTSLLTAILIVIQILLNFRGV